MMCARLSSCSLYGSSSINSIHHKILHVFNPLECISYLVPPILKAQPQFRHSLRPLSCLSLQQSLNWRLTLEFVLQLTVSDLLKK